ncbi:uncharacterized protein Dwil_GK28132 [Drosophila willistoni]|uniref:Uncharacterized protein n=1 Tax=Drosophila willistoni TaxID=7260 RepID=A0A0Q9WRA3_DROWI|nr:uncharacterized protein LOC26530134 [Drosophila willistoni]XP_023031918.1 uncharacterized protein LOC26530134 [Drosophila willistoni]KRF98505.1 uncharacterized protein Dwil_GK28132 [Drosophila willistoni]
MDLCELLHQLGIHILDIFKIYLKYAFITLILYFIAEWYILRYGDELEAQIDAHLINGRDQGDRPPSNSTLSKVFRFIVNFFIL